MNIEKKFFKSVAADFVLFALFMFILLVIMIGLLLFITGRNLSSFKEIAVIWSLYPILAAWIQTSINRPGIMTISGLNNSSNLIDSLEAGALNLDFIVTERTDTVIKFDKKSKMSRFINIFGRENLKVILENEMVLIHGKKNILKRLELRIKRDNKSFECQNHI